VDELFASLDSDGDGLISKDEFTTALEQARSAGPPPPPAGEASGTGQSGDGEESFDVADTDEDGYVSAEELAAYLGQTGLDTSSLMAGLDSDGDGLISREEFEAAMQQAPPPAGTHVGSGRFRTGGCKQFLSIPERSDRRYDEAGETSSL
jgi:Ca2+-binding EF-hand superfamily protein